MNDMTTHTYHTPTYYRVRTVVRCAFVAGVALVSFAVGKALATNPHEYQCDGSAVVATAGDTLWSLADKHCTGHVGSAVDSLHAQYGDLSQGEVISFAIGERR